MRDAGTQSEAPIIKAEERDQSILVDTIARDADPTDQGIIAIDRKTAGKNLDAIG